MEHTPGPWTAKIAPDVGILVETGDHELIAIVDSECTDIASCDIAEPNARLIAAAPALLEALKLVAPELHNLYLHHEPFAECDFPECEQARAAIAQVKGTRGT